MCEQWASELDSAAMSYGQRQMFQRSSVLSSSLSVLSSATCGSFSRATEVPSVHIPEDCCGNFSCDSASPHPDPSEWDDSFRRGCSLDESLGMFSPHSRVKQASPGASLENQLSPHPHTPNAERCNLHRPLAVLYSPLSEMPRKVALQSHMSSIRETSVQSEPLPGPSTNFQLPPQPPASVSCLSQPSSSIAAEPSASFDAKALQMALSAVPQVPKQQLGAQMRKLGWDIAWTHGQEELIDHVSSLLDNLKVPHSTSLGSGCMLTGIHHVTDAMGMGEMQARVLVRPVDTGRFRIDVGRTRGDTFQFHAFYRSLRASVAPLISRGEESVSTHAAVSRPQLVAAPHLKHHVPAANPFWSTRQT